MSIIVLLLTTVCILEVNCNCNSTCFNKFNNDVKDNKNSIVKLFDNILEKYGQMDEHLQNLLKKLKETQIKSEKDVNNFGKKVQKNKRNVKKLDDLLKNLMKNVSVLQSEMENLDFGGWPERIQASNDSAHKLADTSILDLEPLLNTLKYWTDFSKMLDNKTESLTDIPHSLQDDIQFIDSLLDNKKSDTDCLENIHQELKSLFEELIKLLGFENSLDEINDIKKLAEVGRNTALNILDESEELKRQLDDAEATRSLANETLQLAEDLNDTINTVDNLLNKYKDDLNSTFDKLMDDFEKDFQALLDKYDVGKYAYLLDKLEMVVDEIETGGYGDLDLEEVQKEIEDDERQIECYSEYIENCQSQKAVSPDCQKRIDELRLIL